MIKLIYLLLKKRFRPNYEKRLRKNRLLDGKQTKRDEDVLTLDKLHLRINFYYDLFDNPTGVIPKKYRALFYNNWEERLSESANYHLGRNYFSSYFINKYGITKGLRMGAKDYIREYKEMIKKGK